MTSQKEDLKKQLMNKYEKGLDKALNEGRGETLWDMEDDVMDFKNEIGRAMMEAKLKLKKNKERGGV
jgi:hypothetical protein